MKISVILAHPVHRSFNHAIARTAVEQFMASSDGLFRENMANADMRALGRVILGVRQKGP